MNINDLTLGQIKEINNMFNLGASTKTEQNGLNGMIGQKVIIRTYSAGVWFGLLEQKQGEEVILKDARRMYRYWCAKSISLSAVANYGIIEEKSKICKAVKNIWIKAIEIIPCTDIAIKSLENAKEVEAE